MPFARSETDLPARSSALLRDEYPASDTRSTKGGPLARPRSRRNQRNVHAGGPHGKARCHRGRPPAPSPPGALPPSRQTDGRLRPTEKPNINVEPSATKSRNGRRWGALHITGGFPLCRYGLRAPFSQERLSRRPDGKVVYKLRRPWPNRTGSDASRSRAAGLSAAPGGAGVVPVFPPGSVPRNLRQSEPVSGDAAAAATIETRGGGGISRDGDLGDAGGVARGGKDPISTERTPRRRVPWAQLLRRVLHLDALA